MIISRASGSPVIAGAIEYASNLVNNNWKAVRTAEFEKAYSAGLKKILEDAKPAKKTDAVAEDVKMPTKEIVTAQIPGIEVMDLEDAVVVLWKAGIYAESGMGCTGPIVLMSEKNKTKSYDLLKEAGYVG